MSNQAEKFWQNHLADTNGPLIHFVPADVLDIESLKSAAGEMGFALFVIEANEINSYSALMDVFDTSMKLPSYFGRDWNALLDLTQDLSWS